MPSQADDSFLRTKSSFVMYFCIGNKVSPCFALSFCSGDGTYSFFKVSPSFFCCVILKRSNTAGLCYMMKKYCKKN